MLKNITKSRRGDFIGVTTAEGKVRIPTESLRKFKRSFLKTEGVEYLYLSSTKEFPVAKIVSYDENVVEYSLFPVGLTKTLYNTWEGLRDDLLTIDRIM